MNLKECYRYANYLDRLYGDLVTFLVDRKFITTTQQEHQRSKANADSEDETVVVKKPYDVNFTPNDVIDLVVQILDEQEALANAVATAKLNTEMNIDNAISMNKKRQNFIGILNAMNSVKSTETQTQGSDYTFNVEKNQVKYFYPVKEITTIDFNRNDVKALAKKYSKICDDVSAKLDSIEINTQVSFNPRFDVNDLFEDVMENFISSK